MPDESYLNVSISEQSARKNFRRFKIRSRARSVQQQDPTDQRGPSRQRHNVDQLATAPGPVSAVPCEVMHRIGFISLNCRHGCTPKVPPRRHVKCGYRRCPQETHGMRPRHHDTAVMDVSGASGLSDWRLTVRPPSCSPLWSDYARADSACVRAAPDLR
jgi:hypothetical protein